MLPSMTTVTILNLALLAAPVSGAPNASSNSSLISSVHHHHHHEAADSMQGKRMGDEAVKRSAKYMNDGTEAKGEGKSHPNCVTVADPRSVGAGWWSQTAKPGSPCVFGATKADEGSHCVEDFDWGSNGWCYTQMDQSEWGPCSDGCPLYGVHSVMGQEIDGVTNDIADIVDNLTQVEQMLPDPQRKKNQKGLAQTNATAVNTTSDAPNVTAAQKGSELHAAALAQSGSVSARSGSRQASRHVQRSQRWRAAAWEEAASLAQTTVSDKRNTARAKLEEAVAFARKAKEQTELWNSLAEKVMLTDHDDAPSMGSEALKRAAAWQKIAVRADGNAKALMKGLPIGA